MHWHHQEIVWVELIDKEHTQVQLWIADKFLKYTQFDIIGYEAEALA